MESAVFCSVDTGEDDADVDADEEEFISIILHVEVYINLPFSKLLELLVLIVVAGGGGRTGRGTLLLLYIPWDSPTYSSVLDAPSGSLGSPLCGFLITC